MSVAEQDALIDRQSIAVFGASTNGKPAGKSIYSEACREWREQFALRGSRSFDDPDTQARVFDRLWDFNVARCASQFDQDYVQQASHKARTFIHEQSEKDREKTTSLTALGLQYLDGEWWPGQWRVEVVNSDPPDAILYAPFLSKAVLMPLSKFDEPEGIHAFVRDATLGKVCLDNQPGFWASIWKGRKGNKKDGIPPSVGLRVKLLQEAKHIEAAPERKTLASVADVVLPFIRQKTKGKAGVSEPNPDQAVQKMEDGVILIRFQAFLCEIQFRHRWIESAKLTELFKAAKADRRHWRHKPGGAYFHVTDEVLRTLDDIADDRLRYETGTRTEPISADRASSKDEKS